MSLFLPSFRLLFSIPLLCSRTRIYNLLYIFRCELVSIIHKVLTYIEYRAVSGVFRPELLTPPPPPLHPASVFSPRIKDGGYTIHTRRAVKGWGSIFRKTPGIELTSYSIIPLRYDLFLTFHAFYSSSLIFLSSVSLFLQLFIFISFEASSLLL